MEKTHIDVETRKSCHKVWDGRLCRRLLSARLVFVTLLFLILCFVCLGNIWQWTAHLPRSGSFQFVDGFEAIAPSEKLQWQPCYHEYGLSYQCAHLTVPMDYHRPLNESRDHPKVHIALVMLPGRNNIESKEFSASPLLLNPGGPGSSGVSFALRMGPRLQKILGIDQDIIGFDPRGIGFTTPRADCWSTPLPSKRRHEDTLRGFFHRTEWYLMGIDIGFINSSNMALKLLDARHRAVAKLCKEKDNLLGSASILRYAATPHVARDMLSIVDAWDAWRDSLVLKPTSTHSRSFVKSLYPREVQLTSLPALATNANTTKGKLSYWGFSYGTFLGTTFASMFPDRVGRMILDGVIDADQYVSSIWKSSLHDTNKVLEQFFRYCCETGDQCQLYRLGDQPTDIQQRFNLIMENLQKNPVMFVDSARFVPVMITASEIKRMLFGSLYLPIASFPVIALVLNLIYENKADALGPLLMLGGELQDYCSPGLPAAYLPDDASIANMCGDKRYPMNETISELQSSYEMMANSSTFADIWMGTMSSCNGWEINVVDPPIHWDDHSRAINTFFPILFLSNTYDPVTPLLEGVTMALQFRDAGLIEQKSEGHCTIAAVSLCTIKAIRAYIHKGIVPPAPIVKGKDYLNGHWTTCQADERPWKPFRSNYLNVTSFEAQEDMEILEAVKELQVIMRMFFPSWGKRTGNRPSIAEALLRWDAMQIGGYLQSLTGGEL